MSPPDVRAYLFDIAEACHLVLVFTATRSASDHARDPAHVKVHAPGTGRAAKLVTRVESARPSTVARTT